MRTPIHAQRWTWPRRALPVLVLATLLGVAGCEKTPVPPDDIPDPPAVAMVEVTPAGAELAIGITLQLEAQAKTADGTVLNRTVSWSSTDPSVATVSSGGLVRGEAPGQATITATVEGVNGTAALTVVIPNLVVTRDTALAGDLMVDSVRIAAGTTVTLTGDLTLRAGGPVEIAGDIAGECRALAVESDAAITVTGDIDTACADLPAGEAPGITLVATGALSLEGGEMRTSGDVELTNDDTLVEDDFNAFAYHEGPMPSSGLNQDSQFACIARDYRFIPDPARATDGANGGPTGGHGADGATWRLGCRGDGLLENVQVYGQGGGDGGRGENMAAADATAQGGDGGNGGLLRGRVTGSLTIRGQGTEFESGDGGQGGPARAEPAPNPAGAQAPSAMALGGDGGIPGLLDVWALGGIQVLDAGVIARIGAGGHGGLAFARGADGASADVRNDVAQAGGNAEAYGGVGANTPDAQLRVAGPSIAANLILDGGDAGHGGNAEAEGGRGGDASALHSTGADGGAMHANGGDGGNAEVRDAAGAPLGRGGNAGFAFFEGGQGGIGWDECRPLLLPGGLGGVGGSTTGSDGTRGTGASTGLLGEVVIADGTGDGGRGGNGLAPGTGGAPGQDGTTAKGQRVLGTAFQAGSVGAPCVIPQLLEPLRDFGAVLGDENLFWQFLVEPPNEGPIDHPSPQIPSQDRPNDYMRVHRIASLALDIDASQAAALSEAFACGDRANGWTRTPTSSPQGPMAVSGCDQNGGQVVPGRHFVFLAAMADDLPMATSDWHSFVMALDADGDASNNYMATPGFENDPYAGTDRFYELNHTPGQGWRMVGVDARNTQPVEIPTGGRAIVDRNLILMLVPAAESAVANPGVRFVGFRHQGQFGLTGNPWAMDVQPRRPGFVPTVSIPPLTTPGG